MIVNSTLQFSLHKGPLRPESSYRATATIGHPRCKHQLHGTGCVPFSSPGPHSLMSSFAKAHRVTVAMIYRDKSYPAPPFLVCKGSRLHLGDEWLEIKYVSELGSR